MSSGKWHTCGLREDGTPVCWGWDKRGQASSQHGVTLTAITSGGAHTCGLREDGRAVCWGSNIYDWDSKFGGQASPPYGETLSAVRAGEVHTCAFEKGTVRPSVGGPGSHEPLESVNGEESTDISSEEDHVCG